MMPPDELPETIAGSRTTLSTNSATSPLIELQV
jgi:hypothetical protein